jgi:nucleoside 2-deoxyribosyltransferase
MRIYLAGPMTGYEEYNYPLFKKATAQLRAVGMNVADPTEIDYGETEETRGGKPYATYMRAGLKLLLECDAIAMLPGWELSKGCRHEFYVATALDHMIFFYDPSTQTLTTSSIPQEYTDAVG